MGYNYPMCNHRTNVSNPGGTALRQLERLSLRLVQTLCQINVRRRTGFCRLHNWTGPVRTDLNGSQ